jgi:hypothetical protein
MEALLISILLYVLLPLWLVAGVGDYLCHRRAKLENTSGLPESALHVLQAALVGIPLVVGLFFEVNALVLLILIAGALLHTLAALWDGLYTHPRRNISAIEQHIHSHLEYIPLVAVLIVTVIHWPVFLQLIGLGTTTASFSLQAKREPLPVGVVVAVLGSVFLFQGALLAEELVRAARAAARSG